MSETKSKIFIRQMSSGKVLSGEGLWGKELDEAKCFSSMLQAMEYCTHQNLSGVEVVMRMGAPQYDIVLPFHNAMIEPRTNRSGQTHL